MSHDDAHLSIDQLADLGADLTAPADAAAADAHLRSCQTCRETQDLLAEVPGLLASAALVAMPADVTARVVAAIEREQIARAGEAETSRAGDTARAWPERAGLRRRFGARLGAGLLGAAAVLGGGYLVLSGLGGGDDSASPTSAGAVEDAEQFAEDGGGSDEGARESTSADVLTYSADSLDQDVQQLLAAPPAVPAESERASQDSVLGPDGELSPGTKTCIAATQRRAGSDADPLAVDLSTYEGEPAVVIVLPDGAQTDSVDVWVVSSACAGADDKDVAQAERTLEVLRNRTVLR